MFTDDSKIKRTNGARLQAARRGLAGVVCALALFLPACGGGSGGDAVCGDSVCDSSENPTDCPEDCGCGNGIVNSGEECDGSNLNDATCQSETGQGGTLACNSDCTLDVSDCTLPSCGNGTVEEGEVCDGEDLAGGSCSAIGYSGGDISCTPDCAYDTSACCNDSCQPQGATACVGDSLRSCAMQESGCLAWETTDCAASGDVCDDSGEPAICTCTDRCAEAGLTRCAGAVIETCMTGPSGCLAFQQTTDCGMGNVCAEGPEGPVCTVNATAEDCSDPYPLVDGENVVPWTALDADYLTSGPSCNPETLVGPDIVLSYTAPEDGFLSFDMPKGNSDVQPIVVSDAACGTVTPELACVEDEFSTTQGGEIAVNAGVTYHFYLRDTDDGDAPLPSPLVLNVDETLCSELVAEVTSLSPPNDFQTFDQTQVFSAEFNFPVDPGTGVITVTGNMGTDLSFDLSTAPPEVAFTDGGRTLIIDPGVVIPEGERVTVSWSGLQDATCGTAVASPTWGIDVLVPPCEPGSGGVVNGTLSRLATTDASGSNYYVAADTDPNGYVYEGDTNELYRTPKAGGTTEDVDTAASLGFSELAYAMLIQGDDVYTVEDNFSGTTEHLWRITTDGGATWSAEDYLVLPQDANDGFRAAAHHNGRIYLATDDFLETEIWSVPAGATTVPQTAMLEVTVSEADCTGLAMDDLYFYLACSDGDRLVRVDRSTDTVELITDTIDFNSTTNSVHTHDTDGDGVANVLYVASDFEEVNYVCEPAATGPFFVDILAFFGGGTSNYGLGFDPVNAVLWMFDDDTDEFVRIE